MGKQGCGTIYNNLERLVELCEEAKLVIVIVIVIVIGVTIFQHNACHQMGERKTR